jgi:hypothetical protein
MHASLKLWLEPGVDHFITLGYWLKYIGTPWITKITKSSKVVIIKMKKIHLPDCVQELIPLNGLQSSKCCRIHFGQCIQNTGVTLPTVARAASF